MSDPPDSILLERRGPVCVLTLHRPDRLNAASRELHRELAVVWAKASSDPGTGAIVLTGAGRAFCAGGDAELLRAMTADEALRSEVLQEGAAIVRAMIECPLPIVAAVNGPAVGLGWSLASTADFVVAADDAFFADPHVSMGLVAGDGGALTIPLLAGLLRAKEFVLLGDRLSAVDAERVGLVNRVVPRADVLGVAIDIAARLASYPSQAMRETKRLLNLALARSVESSLDDALAAEATSFNTEHFQRNLASLVR
jgi:enoyl-CoA hydratase